MENKKIRFINISFVKRRDGFHCGLAGFCSCCCCCCCSKLYHTHNTLSVAPSFWMMTRKLCSFTANGIISIRDWKWNIWKETFSRPIECWWGYLACGLLHTVWPKISYIRMASSPSLSLSVFRLMNIFIRRRIHHSNTIIFSFYRRHRHQKQ